MEDGVSDLDEENCFLREDMFLILVVFSGKKFWEKWGKFTDLIKISAILIPNWNSLLLKSNFGLLSLYKASFEMPMFSSFWYKSWILLYLLI